MLFFYIVSRTDENTCKFITVHKNYGGNSDGPLSKIMLLCSEMHRLRINISFPTNKAPWPFDIMSNQKIKK